MKKKEPKTNFTGISIILATLGQVDELTGLPVPLFPEPRQVRAEDIWPDYMLDWKKKKNKCTKRIDCNCINCRLKTELIGPH